jgi:PAS domain S-box-containing protein
MDPRDEERRDPDWQFDALHPGAYRSLVEGAPAVLYIDRPDELSTNLYTSPQIEILLGFTVEEWTSEGDLWVRQIHPDDREVVLEANRRSNEHGDSFLAEYRVFAKDGRVVWIRDEASAVRGDDGRLLYWRGVMLDITSRKETEDKLRWSLDVLRRTLQQRRELAQRLQQAQEAERRRIAADIHDDPIQVMSAVDMRLQMLAAYPEQATPGELVSIEADVRLAIERLRSLLFELRPAALDREGLVPALRLYLEHTAAVAGWNAEVHDHLDDDPPPDQRALLFRIVQEAVTNVRKHANASHVAVDVTTSGGGVIVRVRDDGVGFTPDLTAPPVPGHLGLSTIVEGAELAGGWARLTSAPGEGTTLECWLPLDPVTDAGA